MEGNLSSGNMISGSSFGGFDLQGSIRVHNHHHHHQHQQQPISLHAHPIQGSNRSMVHPSIHEGFPLSIGSMQDCNKSVPLSDYGKGEGVKSPSDDEELNFAEDGVDQGSSRGKKAPMWHRVKWTDEMVRLLITAVSYIGEEASSEYGGRRKCSNLHKKGKWKSVSKVMAERGHFVSPQQCEDKFNDLNKRYKRLNEILGRGTSCEVVENPALLDMMIDVSEKAKEEVRKILSSKHLHYEEMCSYHNGNRLHLPPDPDLQRSLRLALRTRDDTDDSDPRPPPVDDHDHDNDDDLDAELDEHEEYEENHNLPADHRTYGYGTGAMQGGSAKKPKPNAPGFRPPSSSQDCSKTFGFPPHNANLVPYDDSTDNNLQKRWMDQRSLQLEEQKLHIQAQMLDLEKERFKWQRFSQKKDFELDMMRMENERMKLENERMALELKRKEMNPESGQ